MCVCERSFSVVHSARGAEEVVEGAAIKFYAPIVPRKSLYFNLTLLMPHIKSAVRRRRRRRRLPLSTGRAVLSSAVISRSFDWELCYKPFAPILYLLRELPRTTYTSQSIGTGFLPLFHCSWNYKTAVLQILGIDPANSSIFFCKNKRGIKEKKALLILFWNFSL